MDPVKRYFGLTERADIGGNLFVLQKLMEGLYRVSTEMKCFSDRDKSVALQQIMETYELLSNALNSIADYLDRKDTIYH